MKPEERITTYLFAHKSKVEYSTMEQVVNDVKLSVFYGMSPLSDDAIQKVVAQWASIHAIGLLTGPPADDSTSAPEPGKPKGPSDSELIDTVKKAVSTVIDGVTIGKKGANVNIGVKGLTANLKRGNNSASAGISVTGTLKLDAASGPFHFSGELSNDHWQITLSFPQDTYIPNLSSIGKVFTEGERAVGKIAGALESFDKVSDAGKVGALIKPHTAAVQDAIDAARGVYEANKKGGPSFGFKIGSPQPMPGEQGIPSGVEGSVVFTWVF